MDTPAIELDDAPVLAPELARVDAVRAPVSLAVELARLHARGIDALFAFRPRSRDRQHPGGDARADRADRVTEPEDAAAILALQTDEHPPESSRVDATVRNLVALRGPRRTVARSGSS